MESIVVGVLTGIISSVIVSEFYRRGQVKKERIFNFENDKQKFSKYIKLIALELELYQEIGKKERLLTRIDEGYNCPSFVDEHLSTDASRLIEDVKTIINELRHQVSKNTKITDLELIKYNIELYKAELNILGIKLKYK